MSGGHADLRQLSFTLKTSPAGAFLGHFPHEHLDAVLRASLSRGLLRDLENVGGGGRAIGSRGVNGRRKYRFGRRGRRRWRRNYLFVQPVHSFRVGRGGVIHQGHGGQLGIIV